MAPFDVLSSAACLVLASTFAVAAVAKTARPRATAAAFHGLGLPVPSVLARLVPASEAAVCAALLLSHRVGGLLAAFLLVMFTGILLAAGRRGAEVRCACFGSATHAPVTTVTFVRNTLLVLAACTVVLGHRSVLSTAVVLCAFGLTLLGACTLALVELHRSTGGILTPQAPGAIG